MPCPVRPLLTADRLGPVRRDRAVVVVVAVSVVVLCAAASWVLRSGGPDETKAATDVVPGFVVDLALPIADPTKALLPEPSADFAAWVDGPGAPVDDLQAAVITVLENPAVGCDELAGRFQTTTAPDDLVALAQDAPDDVGSELIVSEVFATGRVLSACANPDSRGPAVAELAYQWAVLALYLDASRATR